MKLWNMIEQILTFIGLLWWAVVVAGCVLLLWMGVI